MKLLISATSASAILAGHAALAQCPPTRVASPTPWTRSDFGESVRVRDEVAVVADPGDDSFCSTPQCNSGAVHVFRQRDGVWRLDETIYHSRISPYDGFGGALALDSAARFAATAGGEVIGGVSSAVYIFEHDGEAWRETAEIQAVEPVSPPAFGASLAIQDDTLVVGQLDNACWVYRERNGRWELDQRIEAPPSPSFTWFAAAMDLRDDWLVVGAPHDSTHALRGGLVHLYHRDGGDQFELVQTLAPPERERSQQGLGTAVAIEKGVLVVGAPFLDSRVGAAFVYELEAGSWALKEELRGSPVYSDFGASVSLREDTVIVGAPVEFISEEEGLGAAYLFRRKPDGTWSRRARLLPSPPSALFGESVDTDGASLIVGAPSEPVGTKFGAGAAHIFDLGCLLCRADVDGDGELTIFDFLAFQNLFAAGDPAADFDGSGVLDFLAFQNEFTAGCA